MVANHEISPTFSRKTTYFWKQYNLQQMLYDSAARKINNDKKRIDG